MKTLVSAIEDVLEDPTNDQNIIELICSIQEKEGDGFFLFVKYCREKLSNKSLDKKAIIDDLYTEAAWRKAEIEKKYQPSMDVIIDSLLACCRKLSEDNIAALDAEIEKIEITFFHNFIQYLKSILENNSYSDAERSLLILETSLGYVRNFDPKLNDTIEFCTKFKDDQIPFNISKRKISNSILNFSKKEYVDRLSQKYTFINIVKNAFLSLRVKKTGMAT